MFITRYLFFVKKRASSTRMTFYSILVTVIGLSLLLFSVVFPEVLRSGRRSINKCLNDNIDSYAVALIDDKTFFDADIGNKIYDQIIRTKEIDSFGEWSTVFVEIEKVLSDKEDLTDKLKEIQNSNLKILPDRDPGMFQGVYMQASALKYNKISLELGYIPSIEDNQRFALLGSNFSDIPIGTVIMVRPEREYIVTGIMSNNQEIVNSMTLLNGDSGLAFDYTTNLDNMILLVNPEISGRAISSSVNFVSFSEGVSFDEGKKILENIFSANGTMVKVGKLLDRIDEVMTRTDWILSRFGASAVIFLVLTILGILSIQLMAFFTRKDEIGIWFSNGIGHKDITRILFIENLIKMAVSYVIAIAIYLWVLNLNKISKSTMYYLRWVLFVYGPLITLLVSIGIAAGVCLVSNIYLRKKSIPDVINGNW